MRDKSDNGLPDYVSLNVNQKTICEMVYAIGTVFYIRSNIREYTWKIDLAAS